MLRTFLLDCNFVWETNRSKKVLKNYTAITKTWPILCKLDHSKRNVIISKNFYMGQCICKPNSTLQWRHQNRILLLLNGNLANANMPTCLGVATRGHRELERWYISFSIVCPKTVDGIPKILTTRSCPYRRQMKWYANFFYLSISTYDWILPAPLDLQYLLPYYTIIYFSIAISMRKHMLDWVCQSQGLESKLTKM